MTSADERYQHALYRQMHPDEYPDRMETVKLFLALADEGYGPAQAKAGGFLKAMGKPEEALANLRKACDQNVPVAFTSMGITHYRGECGLPVSHQKAMECYQRAADLGDKDGVLNLGLMYESGEGCPEGEPMYDRAASCFRKLTGPDDPDPDACFHLACLCLQGKLGSSDRTKVEGTVMMREAASMGHRGAMELIPQTSSSVYSLQPDNFDFT